MAPKAKGKGARNNPSMDKSIEGYNDPTLDIGTSDTSIGTSTSTAGMASNKPLNYGEKIHEQRMKFEEVENLLSVYFQVLLSDGAITREMLSTLAETCSRVPIDKLEGILKNSRQLLPKDLYLWSIANADIVFPYLTLDEAVKRIKHSAYVPRSWGVNKEGEIVLPKAESLQSNTWILIREILKANGCRISKEEVDLDSSVPLLDNDAVAKNPAINTILIRILELARSPLSATIRSEKKGINTIKNAVDYVILDSIYQSESVYSELTQSGHAVSQGRRTVKVEYQAGSNKVEYRLVYTGYKLAGILSSYLPASTSKSPEGEPFFKLFHMLIQNIIPKELGDYSLPKSFFESPSTQLRANIREGPKIKTSSGTRHNLYIPLSFVKSSECERYPSAAKKDIVNIGSEVLLNLDHINKFTVKESCKNMAVYKDYLSLAYSLSDMCREKWKQEQQIVSPDDIRHIVIGNWNTLTTTLEREEYIRSKKQVLDQLVFVPASNNPATLEAIRASIESVKANKKTYRTQVR